MLRINYRWCCLFLCCSFSGNVVSWWIKTSAHDIAVQIDFRPTRASVANINEDDVVETQAVIHNRRFPTDVHAVQVLSCMLDLLNIGKSTNVCLMYREVMPVSLMAFSP